MSGIFCDLPGVVVAGCEKIVLKQAKKALPPRPQKLADGGSAIWQILPRNYPHLE